MVKHKFLNIFPKKTIVSKIDRENLQDKIVEQNLINEIEDYISEMEMDTIKILEARDTGQISSKESLRFFRSHERYQNTKFILQYLLAFLKKLPNPIEISEEPVNPFMQFKFFIINLINQLNEVDVRESILREHERLGLLTDKNLWYYEGQIDKCHKELIELTKNAKIPIIEHFRQLFEALQGLSLFWFSIRSENIKRTRISDLHIYKLTKILLDRTEKEIE